MKIVFDSRLKADLSLDDAEHIRYIDQTKSPWTSSKESPTTASIDYINQIADLLQVPKDQLKNIHQRISFLEPLEQGIEYRVSEEKRQFDTTTVGFYQTYHNIPVWQAGFTVTVKSNPNRIVSVVNTSQEGLDAKLPSQKKVAYHKRLFRMAELNNEVRRLQLGEEKQEFSETADFVRHLLGRGKPRKESEAFNKDRRSKVKGDNAELMRGRLYIYKYDEKTRLPPHITKGATTEKSSEEDSTNLRESDYEPFIPLPPVNKKINDGQFYLVAEITFSFATKEYGNINWLALVELETDSVLYLRALAANLNGMVFRHDPITSSGNADNSPDKNSAVLNPLRSSELLSNLNAPVSGVQSLTGRYAKVINVEDPNIAPPTKPAGTDFNYDCRTNDYAAVSSYYHTDRFFALVESLGFSIATYFNQTTFPIPVDHRACFDDCPTGNEVNGYCQGNGAGGIGHVGYMLADITDTSNPIGRACDWRVHLHELGGHGVLYEHVNSANFRFAHSAGDSISLIVNDPESRAPDRFRYAPWSFTNLRRCDRDVAAGWAWGGHADKDDRRYGSEQILSTTLFRVYLSIGGNSTDLGRRRFASRLTAYLILRAIATLMPGIHNPDNPLGFVNALMTADSGNWTTEGVYGGAYSKVIRWSFEQQGLYQPPGGPTPVTAPGQPPPVDVYIEDGRGGEYSYQHVHWNNTSIWNRRAADGIATHEEPIVGNTNYVYVNIKNRGTKTARNVMVRGFHCRPSAGTTWPNDFQSLSTPEIAVGTVAPDNSEEKVVGPFEWIPITNGYGHDCILMIVSADDDPSNVDNFAVGEFIPDWRLVPNDNNIGQRNVHTVPGGGSTEGLMRGLNGHSFWVGNPNLKTSSMELRVELPEVLASTGWRLNFDGISDNNKFELQPGKQQEIFMNVIPGKEFSKDQVEKSKNKDIVIYAYADDILVGGMTYLLDPNIKEPFNKPDEKALRGIKTLTTAERWNSLGDMQEILSRMNISDQKIRNVSVKKVTVEIELHDT
jgi:hypothetical protein